MANVRKVGNFAFLLIEVKQDEILNRELQSDYVLLVRATARRKKSNALETSTTVNLKILDRNDNRPMFKQLEYSAIVGDLVDYGIY